MTSWTARLTQLGITVPPAAGTTGRRPTPAARPRADRAMHLFHLGRWDEADRLLAGCPAAVVRGRYGRALLAAARGDAAGAWRLTDDLVGSGMSAARLYGAHARTLAALGRRDFVTAFGQATAAVHPGEPPTGRPHALSITLDLAEAAVRTGRPDVAAAHAGAVNRAGVTARSPRLALLAAGATALAAPPDESPELFDAALAVPYADRWPFDLARIRLCYGERLRRNGRAREARVQLAAALDITERLGATPWAARAAAELRATAPTRARSGAWGSARLTPQEREIAELAARGLTNKAIGERLYVSRGPSAPTSTTSSRSWASPPGRRCGTP